MNLLIAPNSFKHALDAASAAKALERGIRKSFPEARCTLFPVGDGGDGTGELIVAAKHGKVVKAETIDPRGRLIMSSFGLIDGGKTAVIEMAKASGINLIAKEEREPLTATSYGTGVLILHALDAGVNKIILGMGGSATVDGGIGILQALGVKFLKKDGKEVIIAADLVDVEYVNPVELDPRILRTEIIVLCDVQNLLLGEEGAAAIFGPQKGASSEAVNQLEKGLAKLNAVVQNATQKEMAAVIGGGTAGGAAAGLYAMINAKLENGIDYFLDLNGFDDVLHKADRVITGEGSLDEQTLHGKAPYGVAKRAHDRRIKVIGLAGKIDDPRATLSKYFDELICINEKHEPLAVMLKNTAFNLERVGTEIGKSLL
ncbi:MAG TPA: glycerate kinase [Chitinophagaceae bacterium]|nr:glycerate kinase [Chitinophagaceae bacterium]